MSHGELKITNFLNSRLVLYNHQHWFKDCRSNIGKRQILKFDFYIPTKNLLIEYDGAQHFKQSKFGNHTITKSELRDNQRRDRIKSKYARSKNIKLLRIKYTQINQIDDILSSEFHD